VVFIFSKNDLLNGIKKLGIKPTDTLLIHSSMKAIGKVENGADTVLDAFMEYMKDGLLIFPTHTWDRINEEHNIYDPLTEPSCVGILTNQFMKRPGVYRSLHPTHSVAAYGKDAKQYIEGEENYDTPCPRSGCWGKLYDRKAKILFLGCSLKKNTFLHSVEEWNKIPDRLADNYQQLKIKLPDGRMIDRPMHRHYSSVGDVSANYDKMLAPYLLEGIAKKGFIGDAECVLCDAAGMAVLTTLYLKRNPKLFSDDKPIPEDWYIS
jgi:aminoglycoside 3-N-acetyltransferase